MLRESVLSISIAETSFNGSKPASPESKRLNHIQFPTSGNKGLNLIDLEATGSAVSKGSVPMIRTCGFEGCTAIAVGGKCEFRICFTNGCNRVLCKEHTAKSENMDEGGLKDKVCVECQPRVDRVTMLWLIILIGIPFLLSVRWN